MKNFIWLAVITILLSSCGSSTDVVNNGFFQKRKHRAGFYFNGLAKANDFKRSEARDNNQLKKQIPNDLYTDNIELHNDEDSSFSHKFFEVKSNHNKTSKSLFKGLKKGKSANAVEPEAVSESGIEKVKSASSDPSDPLKTAGILSIVFAILSILLLQVPIVNLIFSGLAIFFGRKARSSEDSGVQSMGQIGAIIGIVTGILGVLYILFIAAYLILIFAFIGF